MTEALPQAVKQMPAAGSVPAAPSPDAPAEVLLRVEDLELGFYPEESSLLNEIGFSLSQGEILGICGESGCGKSMTALALIGLLPEHAFVKGRIFFKGRELLAQNETEWRSLRGREIAMIFQDSQQALNPLQRVGRQVGEALRIHHPGLSRQECRRRVLEIFERVELPQPKAVFRSFPHELSGGMRQRVCMALALINHPSLLLADEATTALDLSVQEKVLALLERFRREDNLSILFISHDIRVVRRFCDRVLIYYAGEIVEEGRVEDVFAAPAHPYTRLLLAAMPGMSPPGSPLAEIPGRVPSSRKIEAHHHDPHPLCIFAPRCPSRQAVCEEKEAPRTELGGRSSLCHRAAEILAEGRKQAAEGRPGGKREGPSAEARQQQTSRFLKEKGEQDHA